MILTSSTVEDRYILKIIYSGFSTPPGFGVISFDSVGRGERI